MNRLYRHIAVIILLIICGQNAIAQENGTIKNKKFKLVKNGSFYLSWGYNKEWYSRSNVHINQPSEGNNYTLHNVKAHDNPGWNKDLFKKELTIPQYNYRIGYFFNEKQDWAFEINFDHTKYIIATNQNIRLKGTLNNQQTDADIVFAEPDFFYFLNNGANFLLFNLVKRYDLYHISNNKLKFDLLCKAGIGPVIPHVENSLFGKKNNPGFQIGGWNTGVEMALRSTFMKYAYLEFAHKGDYARYSGLNIYNGKARQAFFTYELILSLGITFPTGKNNMQFVSHR